MPNWVNNVVHMRNIGTNKTLYDDEGNFDFNKIKPMPDSLNMDDGTLMDTAIQLVMSFVNSRYDRFASDMKEDQFATDSAIVHYNPKLKRDIQFYMEREKIDFETAVSNLIDLGLQYIGNIARYKYPTWYGWSIENWGTKWNACYTQYVNDSCVKFDTAWNAPYEVLTELSSQYPYDEIIDNWVEESGLCGSVSFLDGEIIEEKEYMIDWESAHDEDGNVLPKLFSIVNEL